MKRKTINSARRLCPRVQVLCEKYWPRERGTVNHGLIQVTTVDYKRGPDYFVTTINLRQVRHRRIHQSYAGGFPCASTGTAIDHRLKDHCGCFPLSETLSNRQDHHTLLLPFLARSGGPHGSVLSLLLCRTHTKGFGSRPAVRSCGGALQVRQSAPTISE